MKGFKYPIPVTPCRYVTEVGGCSRALAEGRVGINNEALRQNTGLSLNDRVLLDVLGEKGEEATPPEPLYRQSAFRIEPLRRNRGSRLLSMSINGEAVLPHVLAENFDVGDEVVLNSLIQR